MDTTSVAYVLCRIEDDSSLTPVSEHEDIVAAVAAGKHQVEVEDFEFSYGLYVDGGRVASFAEGRVGYREWARRNGRLSDIHSIDDRYDHDELIAICSVGQLHCIDVQNAYSEEVRKCPWVHGLRGDRYHRHRKPLW
jgi:hypothetical protein